MTDEQAAELAMRIDAIGDQFGLRVVDGSGFRGVGGMIFAVELRDGSRRLVTREEDLREIEREAQTVHEPPAQLTLLST